MAIDTKRLANLPPRYSNASGTAGLQRNLYRFPTGTIFTAPRLFGEVTARYYATLAIACDGASFQLRIGESVETLQAAIIRPGEAHDIRAQDGRFILVRLNPTHPLFRRCCRIGGRGILRLEPCLFAALMPLLTLACDGALDAEQSLGLYSRLRIALAGSLPTIPTGDARVDRVLRYLAHNPNCALIDVARFIGVSPSRFSHFFRDGVGVCVKTYLCWQRMHRAFEQIDSGRSLTEIANDVGYTDLSHFGREFREFVAAPPSRWLRRVAIRSVVDVATLQIASQSSALRPMYRPGIGLAGGPRAGAGG